MITAETPATAHVGVLSSSLVCALVLSDAAIALPPTRTQTQKHAYHQATIFFLFFLSFLRSLRHTYGEIREGLIKRIKKADSFGCSPSFSKDHAFMISTLDSESGRKTVKATIGPWLVTAVK